MLVYHIQGTFETREHHLDTLWEIGATGLEERAGLIRAYFDERIEMPEEISDGSWQEEADQDWQAEFRRTLQPVQAGKITIVAPWQTEQVPDGQKPLIIEPGMAFGTGHHATTRMAVTALSEHDLAGKSLIDVGTGSGVLAIAGAILGAKYCLGLDIDPITIPIARQNATDNGLSVQNIRFEEGTLDGSAVQGQVFDVLVANLYAELHDLLAEEYSESIPQGAPIILTGILVSKLALVTDALKREGFTGITIKEDSEWALVTARKG